MATHVYKIFEHPSGKREIVKQGWSWPGFWFNLLWVLAKRMWGLGAALWGAFLGFDFLMGVVAGVTNGPDPDAMVNTIATVANIIVAIVLGVNGNALRERNMVKRGYELAGTVEGASSEGALGAYLKQRPAVSVVPRHAEAH
jgi:hypothetical protein